MTKKNFEIFSYLPQKNRWFQKLIAYQPGEKIKSVGCHKFIWLDIAENRLVISGMVFKKNDCHPRSNMPNNLCFNYSSTVIIITNSIIMAPGLLIVVRWKLPLKTRLSMYSVYSIHSDKIKVFRPLILSQWNIPLSHFG